ncbi:hypothetical protein HMN09_01092900 [Mycena chlorophos]|uniref:F-box domain-containing protein n=1 Tax=Mycena chlorophos TaxID=658473 RepID=A0A8H6SBA1_MYCCL|nr:hypothetical protein HMN09_01092900 [Mycena chlorophos]
MATSFTRFRRFLPHHHLDRNAMAQPRNLLLDLPVEIVWKALHLLPPKDLAPVALVSREAHDRCIPVLYGDLDDFDDMDACILCLRTLAKNVAYGKLVRRLDIGIFDQDGNIDEEEVTDVFLSADIELVAIDSEETIDAVEATLAALIGGAMRNLPGLLKFTLRNGPEVYAEALELIHCAQLETVTMRYSVATHTFISNHPTLRHVSFPLLFDYQESGFFPYHDPASLPNLVSFTGPAVIAPLIISKSQNLKSLNLHNWAATGECSATELFSQLQSSLENLQTMTSVSSTLPLDLLPAIERHGGRNLDSISLQYLPRSGLNRQRNAEQERLFTETAVQQIDTHIALFPKLESIIVKNRLLTSSALERLTSEQLVATIRGEFPRVLRWTRICPTLNVISFPSGVVWGHMYTIKTRQAPSEDRETLWGPALIPDDFETADEHRPDPEWCLRMLSISGCDDHPPEYVVEAEEWLAGLREKDAAFVRDLELKLRSSGWLDAVVEVLNMLRQIRESAD